MFWLQLARRQGWFDEPGERSMHTVATPSGGGVAIALVMIAALLWAEWPRWVVCMAAFVAAIGVIDDLRPLPVLPRLAGQTLAVAVGLYAIGGLSDITVGAEIYEMKFAAQLLVGLACIWFLNLYNFMDGIDGLAASELIFVALAAVLFTESAQSSDLWLAFAGTGAGFLLWNRAPARIFMGDAGSGFIGFLLALFLVRGVSAGDFSLWTALILVAPFACDATVTLLRRMLRGEQWYRPHVSHAYQHLARRLGGHGPVVTRLAMLNIVVVLPAAWFAEAQPRWAPLIAAALLGMLAALVFRLGAGKVNAHE